MKDVRQIAHNLSPVIIENFGFAGAVKILLRRMEDAGMDIRCTIDDPAEVLSSYQQLVLYRIIQEVIGNVVKHAEASEITFDLHHGGSQLSLLMSDNGKGFDMLSGQKASGMGMSTIRTRTDLLGAKLESLKRLPSPSDRASLDKLVERALRVGPAALTDAERTRLCADAASMRRLHREAWQRWPVEHWAQGREVPQLPKEYGGRAHADTNRG